MNDTAGGFGHPLFGLLLDGIHFEALPQTNCLVCSDGCDSREVWSQGQTENAVLMTWKTKSFLAGACVAGPQRPEQGRATHR